MTRTINITPTWRQAAQIIAAALENGTDAGREAARAELFRMGDLLDAWRDQPAQTETPAAAPASDAAEARTVYLIGKPTQDSRGNPFTVYLVAGHRWTRDPWEAAQTNDEAQAARDAADWSEYWASKGLQARAHVEPWTLAQIEAAQIDHLAQIDQPERLELFEVIAHRDGQAFGQTFTAQENAQAYAAAMRRAGYQVDPFPMFEPVRSFAEAMQEAARFFEDARLNGATK
jgi:hypothetical protein